MIFNYKLNRLIYHIKFIKALTTITTFNNNGVYKFWKVNGKIHRDDGPAWIQLISKENPNSTHHEYYLNEKLHRGCSQDGTVRPAIIYGISNENPNGTYHAYYKHGELHRDDGPATITGISKENPQGTYHSYYKNGVPD